MSQLLILLLLGIGTAFAASSEWQGDDGTNPTHWDVPANWQGGVPAPADDATFSDTGTAAGSISATVSLNGSNQTIDTLTFNNHKNISVLAGNTLTVNGGIVVTGGSHAIACGVTLGATSTTITVAAGATLAISGNLSLGANTVIDVGAGGVVTLSGTVSGAFNLIKAGDGQLTLSGSNTYSGTTGVGSGVLSLASSGAINGTSSISVTGTGQVSVTGNAFLAAVPISLNTSTVPALVGASGFNLWTGAITLAQASTVQSNSGTLVIGGTITNGGSLLTGAGAGDVIISGAITGSGGLTKNGTGTLTLLGTNTYTGATTVSAGSLVAQSATALGDDGATSTTTSVASGAALILDGSFTLSTRESVTINGTGGSAGALQVRSGSPSIAGTLTLGSASTVTALNAGSTLTVSGVLTAPSFLLTYQGAGTLLLTNSGNHAAATGGVTVTNGTLRLGTANAWPSGAATINGTLDLNGTSPSVTAALAGGGTITSGIAGAATLNVVSGTFSGGVTNGSGTVGLALNGGTLTLSGASTYSGATSITNGTLVVAADGACDNTAITIGSGSTLQVSGSITLGAAITLADGAVANTIASTSGSNILSGVVTIAQATTYPVITADNGTLTLSQATAGSGTVYGLTVSGTGNVTFGGALNLGGTGIRAVGKVGSGTMTVNSATIGSFALNAGTLAFSSGSPLGSSSLTIYGGTLAPFGGANLTVSNATYFYGDFAIASTLSGTFTFSGAIAVGPVAANVVRTVTIDDGGSTVRSVAITGAVTGEGSTTTTLVKAGSDTLTLGGAGSNTFTGLSVQDGLLQATTATRIPAGAAIQVGAGATLDLNDFSASVATLSGSGTVDLGTAALGVTGTSTFAGIVTGVSGSLTVSGNLTLSGASTYTGTTAVTGQLTLTGDSGSINLSPVITLPSGSALTISNTGTANPNRLLDTVDIQMSGGTLAMTAPAAANRSETIGKVTLTGASASSIQVVATGTANCTLTASNATSGLVNSGSASPQVLVTRTDAAGGGKAFFFIQAGYGDNSTVAFARVNGGNAKYTFASGLIATTIDWYSRGTVAEWASVTWYDAPTGGLLRAGYPNTSSDSVNIMSPVTVGGTYNCARLVMSTGGTLAGGTASAYLNITDGTVGTIQATSGTPTIANLGLYSSSVPMIFDIDTGCTLTVNSNWDGSNYSVLFIYAMTKTGGGLLDLQVPTWPGYSGATTVSQGILRLNYNNVGLGGYARPSSCSFSVISPGILELGVDQEGYGGFSGSGTVRASSGVRTLTLGGGSFTGVMANGGGTLALSATGTVDLTGSNTFTGGASVAGGDLRLTGGSAILDTCPVTVASGTLTVITPETIGPLQTGSGSIALNAALTISQGTTSATYSGSTSGSGSLAVLGTTGVLTLTGANGHTGGTTLTSGTVAIASNANLGADAGLLTFNGGRLQLTASVNMTSAAASANVDATTVRPTVSIAASAASARPIAVTASGGTIDMGVYSLAIPAFSTTAGQDLTIFSSTVSTTPAAGDPTLFIQVSGTKTVAGLLKAGAGAEASKRVPFVVVNGSGRLELSGSNTLLSNVWRLEGTSSVAIATAGALGSVSASGWLYTLPGTTFELNSVAVSSTIYHYLSGTMVATSGDSSWAGTTDLHVATVASVPTFNVQTGRILTLSGKVSGTDAWAKATGGGELRLTAGVGVNDASGNATISAGTLSVARDDQLGGAASVLTLDGGTLSTTGSFTSPRTVALGAAGGTTSIPTGLSLTLSGPVGGSGSLTKSGAGILALSGTNTFAGGSVVLAGTLQVGADAGFGAAASGVTINGGTLLTTANLNAGALRGLAIGASGGTVDVTAATTLTWNGALSGSGALAKVAAGTLALSGSNAAFTGAIAVQAGALRATSGTALGGTATGTTVANGAALELTGDFSTAEPLQLAGSGISSTGVLRSLSGIQTISGAVTLVQVATPATVSVVGALTASGAISGGGGLTKLGAGDLTLSGTNTFTGLVSIGGGRVLVTADANLGDGGNGVTLDGGTLVAGATINAASRLLRLTSLDGVIDIPNGGTSLTVPGLDTAVGQDLTLAGTGTLTLNIASGGSTIAGALVSTGTAGLLKTGGGGLAITGGNSGFSTTTTVNGGRLRLDGSVAGPVVVQSGATLGGTGSMGALSVQSGGIAKPGDPVGQGPGVLTATSLSLATGAILDYDLGTANDLISVSGPATVASGVQLNVLSFPSPASFADGTYALVNAGAAPTYTAGSMGASLPNGYSLSAGNARATIGVTGSSLQLSTDSTLPVVSAITSASPDGTYYQSQAFDVTVVFSKPVTPTGAVTARVTLTNGGSPVTRDVTVTAGAYPASQLSGTYTVLNGDITSPGEVNATEVVLAGSITDVVGHSVSGTLSTAGTLSSNKNIIIDNFVPLIQVHTAVAGDTQPPAVPLNTLEARYFDPASNVSPAVLVVASDNETTDPASLTYRILLEPSQGEVQLLTSGVWGAGTTMRVVTTLTDVVTQVDSFTQADINAGNVRYQHASLSGGNDAILFDVTDGDGKTSALYLLRFAVSGNAVPTISGLPASLTYEEESTHAVWAPITAVADISDNDSTFPDGRLTVVLTSPQTGDQIDLRPDATGVTVNGAQISVGAVVVGTLTRTSATSLEVRFDDPTTAGPSEAEAIINAIGYRTTVLAPDPSIARSIQISITDGSVGQTPNLYVIPVQLTLFNDPPIVTLGAPIITVPGLARTFTVSVSDPEGEPALTYTIAAPPSPQATRGALVQDSPGVFTYTPYYPSGSAIGDPLVDAFAITVTDAAFSPISADPLRLGTAAAVTSAPASYTVRISAGGGDAPRFLAPMRMTVAASLPFSFQPEVQVAPGATLTWELVGAPAQLTAAFLLAPPNQASFDTVSGQLSWPSVPAPADATGYYRFGILVTDTTSQTATLLPVMLRVGPGGAG